jgi:hypothetical protein
MPPSVIGLLGAIPIVTADVLRDPLLYSSLYDRLPIVAVEERAASGGGWSDLTPELLGKIYQHFHAAALGKRTTPSVFSERAGWAAAFSGSKEGIPGSIILPRMDTLSVSRLYFSYWLHQYTEDLISGKPPARFFRDVPSSLRKTPPKCLSASTIDSNEISSNGKHRQLLDGQPNANLLKIEHTQQKVGKAIRKRAFQNVKHGSGVVVTNSTTTVFSPQLSTKKSQTTHNKSMPQFTLEIVIPRCCEDGLVCMLVCRFKLLILVCTRTAACLLPGCSSFSCCDLFLPVSNSTLLYRRLHG